MIGTPGGTTERPAVFSRRQRWSPRRPNSNWSNVNVALVEKRLTELVTNCAEGQMIPSQRYGKEPAWVKRAREKLANIDE